MNSELMTANQVFEEYKADMAKLIAYLPWLEEKSGKAKVVTTFDGHDISVNSISFPVYDQNLLRFIKEAQATKFMDRNYVYVITRNRLNSPEAEKKFIKEQTMLQMNNIGGVLAKYVMGGQTKARLWSQAMDDGIFLAVVTKLKELYEYGENSLGE